MSMKVHTRQVDGVTILDLSGRITLGEGSVTIRDAVRDVLAKGSNKILLNLGDITSARVIQPTNTRLKGVLRPKSQAFFILPKGNFWSSMQIALPGVFLFRMASGLLQLANNSNTTLEVLGATIAGGMTAFTIILAMSFGVIAPKIAIDYLAEGAMRAQS